MILFCIPYAGGGETAYYSWKKYLNPSIKLCPIELKGRGKRFKEPYYNNMEEAVSDIYSNIIDKILLEDYAIYGHSMGSVIAYELYYKICNQRVRKPKHMFFSGQNAPSNLTKKVIHNLPDMEFLHEIMIFGGTPKELMSSKELLEIFLPILRNDMRILENYVYKERNEKIDCDISILNGLEDTKHIDGILEWRKHSNKNINIYNFEGDHFFIKNNEKNITKLIDSTLKYNNPLFHE